MENYQEILTKLFNIWFQGKHKLFEFKATFPDDKGSESIREELLPDFFYNLTEFYWNFFFLTIAKLLDPYRQGQNKNLTLFTLSEILKENNKTEWNDVYSKTTELKEKFSNLIKHRRKHLAHFDFDYTMEKKELGTSTHIDEVEYFFDKMLELINLTYKPMGMPERNPAILNRLGFMGGKELNQILKEYKSTVD